MPWRQSPLTRSERLGCLLFTLTLLFLIAVSLLLALGRG